MRNYEQEFIKLLHSIDYSKRDSDVFRDFLEASTYALSLPFLPEAKQKFSNAFNGYNPDQKTKLDQLFQIVVEALESEHQDFIGNIFMQLEMGNDYKGQFFTPYHICKLIAKMQICTDPEQIKRQKFITVSEPAAGAGAMVIALAEEFLQNNLNPATDMYVETIDIDRLAFYMCFIQLSLYGVPAKVICGNTITMEIYETLFTPVYYLNNWSMRLAVRDMLNLFKDSQDVVDQENDISIPTITITPELKQVAMLQGEQMNLFSEVI